MGWSRCPDLNTCAWQNDEFPAKRRIAFTLFFRAPDEKQKRNENIKDHNKNSIICMYALFINAATKANFNSEFKF